MKIQPSNFCNIDEFERLWDCALEYQAKKKYPIWPPFSREMAKHEIDLGNHYSVYGASNSLLGYFSIVHSDPIIWKERERGDAIYIHRMVVNPNEKGGGLSGKVLSWAKEYVLSIKKKFIRMDTWGDNQNLVNYYIKSGFNHIGYIKLGEVPELPAHYSNIQLALFENPVSV